MFMINCSGECEFSCTGVWHMLCDCWWCECVVPHAIVHDWPAVLPSFYGSQLFIL